MADSAYGAPQPSMSEAQWQEISVSVRDRMAAHVWPFVTPLSRSVSETRGLALGTGNYLLLRGSTYVLTNEHVIKKGAGAPMGHLPGPTDDYVACRDVFRSAGWPLDLALMRLGDEWRDATKSTIPATRLDESFSPVQRELLFWLGFPGSTATRHEPVTKHNIRYSWFGELESRGVPMLTQLFPNPPKELKGYDSGKHVVVHFPARAAQNVDGSEEELPNPQGMSGSLLWDTKFVASMSMGREWNPELAMVCALVWAAHPSPEVIVATKIEHLRSALLD